MYIHIADQREERQRTILNTLCNIHEINISIVIIMIRVPLKKQPTQISKFILLEKLYTTAWHLGISCLTSVTVRGIYPSIILGNLTLYSYRKILLATFTLIVEWDKSAKNKVFDIELCMYHYRVQQCITQDKTSSLRSIGYTLIDIQSHQDWLIFFDIPNLLLHWFQGYLISRCCI